MEKELTIEGFSKKGDGLAYLNDVRVEIPHTMPNDHVLADLKKKRKGKIKGRLIKILKKSGDRILPKCSHAEICGGCLWQAFSYNKQLQQKEKIIFDHFSDFITMQNVEIFPIVACADPFCYRNKMEFSFSENKAKTKFLGLMIVRAQSYVFNVEKCYLANEWFSSVLLNVKKWWENSNLLAYNSYDDTGHLRTLTIREAINTNEKMVILTVSGNKEYQLSEDDIKNFSETVKEVITDTDNLSIYLRKQVIEKKVPTKFYEKLLHGKKTIIEKLNIKTKNNEKLLKFNISPASFFQPNTKQAEKLYSLALSCVENEKFTTVYDLYCGTGTLGMIFSSIAKEVIGIDINEKAIEDAKENAKLNKIDNLEFYAGDTGKILTQLLPHKKADLVIVDPPRAGLDELALHQIKILNPSMIVYISCNPATQKDNIKELLLSGYNLIKVHPVDQFPHTAHIENIAVLKKAF